MNSGSQLRSRGLRVISLEQYMAMKLYHLRSVSRWIFARHKSDNQAYILINSMSVLIAQSIHTTNIFLLMTC